MRAYLVTIGALLACQPSADDAVAREVIGPRPQQAAATVPDLPDTEQKLRSSDVGLNDYFGSPLAGAGDVDGDGYADVVIASWRDDDSGSDAGAVYLYYGSATGLDSASELKVLASDGSGGDNFGRGLASAGDVDADGYADLIVGAANHDGADNNAGAAYVYYGSSTGISATSEQQFTASDVTNNDGFGLTVSGAGDLDGDGYDDVAVGVPYDTAAGYQSGSVYVYMGSSSGVDESAETLLNIAPSSYSVLRGSALAHGDFNDDGYDDLIMGGSSYYTGRAYLYLGSATGVVDDTQTSIYPSDTSSNFAKSLAVADFDQDGFDDLVVGASGDDDLMSQGGSLYRFAGSASGIDLSSEEEWITSDISTNDTIGGYLSAGSDIDGDGFPDLLVGVPVDSYDSFSAAGSVYIYFGSPGGLNETTEQKLGASDAADSDYFGAGVAGVGDIDADGFGDFVVGATADDRPPEGGAAYVYYGSCRDADEDGLCKDDDCDDDDASTGAAGTWYADTDGDGYGDASVSTESCDQPTAYVADDTDCDDGDAAVNPGQAEVCDAADTDEDCSGAADDADAGVDPSTLSAWYADTDGDGYGDPAVSSQLCNQPAATVADATDCDDTSAAVNPGQIEICDAGDTDEDCSGAADDADPGLDTTTLSTWYADTDGDGYGDAAVSSEYCNAPAATVADATDCDDTDPGVNPGETEVCDAADTDEDCSGAADDADAGVDPATLFTWYADTDGDGYGDPAVSTQLCNQPTSTVADATDCDDSTAAVSPAQTEVCDAADTDEDCSGAADDADAGVDPTTRTAWYTDDDGDGYGDAATVRGACDPGALEVADATDCDDDRPDVNPGATELCDPDDRDEDCSGAADDADPGVDPDSLSAWYADSDSDGYGDPLAQSLSCDPSEGEVADASDCDDADSAVNPSATEVCDPDDVDEDCSGAADDADPGLDRGTWGAWYDDVDGDGFGDPAGGTHACDPEPGQVADATDCDDGDAAVNPDATEVCDPDNVDEDCSGAADDADPGVDPSSQTTWYADTDGDGFGDPDAPMEACDAATGRVSNAMDCDDTDETVNPTAAEILDDGVDQDCDGDDARTPRVIDEGGDKGSCATGGSTQGGFGLVIFAVFGVLRRRRAA